MNKSGELQFLALGGAGEIGMNLNLYGYGGKWLMVDCGLGFANGRWPGIDTIIPNIEFIAEQKENLVGLVLTHAHEDHIGAVPLLWPQLQCPVYATPFTAGLLRSKLADEGLLDDVPLTEISLQAALQLGPFNISYVTLTHSIAEPNGLIITTPAGRVFHTGDWKIDDNPLIGDTTDTDTLKAIGAEGVLALVCDSTNVLNFGPSGSELDAKKGLSDVIAGQPGKVAVATFASNLARIQTIAEVAAEQGRHTVLVGRSMHRNVAIAKACGYLDDLPNFVAEDEAGYLAPEQTLYLCTGSQGEELGAMTRIARREHKHVTLEADDTAIFSSKIIPGNEVALASVHNMLVAAGVRVITEKDAPVHVSGHPVRADIVQMYGWIKPDIAIPVHGEARHLEAHKELAKSLGVPTVIPASNGTLIRLTPGEPGIAGFAPFGRMARDGNQLISLDGPAIAQRRRTMREGHLVVSLVLDDSGEIVAGPAITLTGIEAGSGMKDAIAEAIVKSTGKLSRRKRQDEEAVREAIRIAALRTCRNICGKRPLTDVQIMRLP